jgi:Cu/Ag efflux protein CusF
MNTLGRAWGRLIAASFVALSLVYLASCRAESDKTYPVKGTIESLDPGNKTARIAHEEIQGYMKAMTMNFRVADVKLLDGLKPGDRVEGTLKVGGGRNELVELKSIDAAR